MSDAAPRWKIRISRQPQKALRRVPRDLRQRIREAIWGLAVDPRPHGCKKLVGYENLYRIRVGSWRIIYSIEDDELIVLVIEIAPRGGAYRGI